MKGWCGYERIHGPHDRCPGLLWGDEAGAKTDVCPDLEDRMSKKHDMLTLWFEENVQPYLGAGVVGTTIPLDVYTESLVASFRDYFSVTLRDELPPHPISQNLERLRSGETLIRVVEDVARNEEDSQ